MPVQTSTKASDNLKGSPIRKENILNMGHINILNVGHGGALVESVAFNRMVVGSM